MPRILVVLGTGGTIAGSAPSPADHLAYRSATLAVTRLLQDVPVPDGYALESEQVAQMDSKDMDFATWRRLSERVAHHAGREDVCAIVVTHGTDTLEETAYFLHRALAPAKPVVLTGAMRPATSSEADGPRNLADALAVATQAAEAAEAGVAVVFAGSVHSPVDVRKEHTVRPDAFGSGDAGPVGRLEAGRLHALRPWPCDPAIGLAALPEAGSEWPWVAIVTSGAGVDARQVDALVGAGCAGIVVAGTGNGMVHRDLEAALRKAEASVVAVLRSSRCPAGGIVEPSGRIEAPAGSIGEPAR
ncbi:MAG TPA: asparaginase [Caldimonas sp.]|nr:asparaginase [Caldimonas sp.]HEX2540538.1 asparaginase [Caldimonas sp.]